MVIQVNALGLAAYIVMRGGKLQKVVNKVFHIDSDRSTQDWRLEYSNSDCQRHDALVCELREHVRNHPGIPN
jgi:hypothetical protein